MAAKKTARNLHEMELLLRVSKQISSIDNLDELLYAIVEICSEETDAERGTLFLSDHETGELYSRVAQGLLVREIRIMNTQGVAGEVFRTGKALIVHDAYNDPRFDSSIDEATSYTTRNLVCVPIRFRDEVIGVLQMLNKRKRRFTNEDVRLLEAMAEQTAIALRSVLFIEKTKATRQQEMQFLEFVSEVTGHLDLGEMLKKIVTEAARMLKADRATLFLHDDRKKELFSRVAMGEKMGEIRIPNHAGIAGSVFTSGQTVNVPYAYADMRFNPTMDRNTGYFTRSILCVPIVNKEGSIIGVTQALNKRGGPFTTEDESRLKAFTAQLAISLENAKLFEDVQNMQNYNESMLQSMSNGVVTLNEEGRIVTCNHSGLEILRAEPLDLVGKTAAEYFSGLNTWVLDRIRVVDETLKQDIFLDSALDVRGEKISVNLTTLPLMAEKEEERGPVRIGSMLMLEDISTEKRIKSTMARYMDPGIADQLLAGGEEVLGGKSVEATVLFSDIRGFTSISEEAGPHATVKLLNEYFTVMVECIQKQGGMLDKFIGDAIMAVFGLPVIHDDDADRAVRASIDMVLELKKFNQHRIAAGLNTIDIGIGLNSDTVVSGNIGSPKRMDYTIIGDGVNLASRLEGACKTYYSRILISQNTLAKLKGTYRVREVDRVVVKGKHEPISIFEVLDYHTDETFPSLMEAVSYFKGGLAHYRKQQWDRAIEAFGEALRIQPSDKLVTMYIDRCAHLKAEAPSDDWDGVWVMKTK